MSNPYQEHPETLPIVKNGLTWAEWSIVVAVILWIVAGLYAWHAQASATKAWKEADAAKAEKAVLAKVKPEDVKKYIDDINKLSFDVKRLQADLTIWKSYAADLDRFVDAELAGYWTSKRNQIVPRPKKPQ
ncbi:MAG: hypothetical protein LBI05_05835 [Planctomycetaceae bacterium]|jgi:hypothetical protein|nr:hypothetical protein [Planctomycetaceae bacterium]